MKPDDNPRRPLRHRIYEYAVEEVTIPDPVDPKQKRQAWKMTIRGDYFHVGAMPLTARVGDVPAMPDQVSVDGTRLEAYLLKLPPEGARVVVTQGPNAMESSQPFRHALIRAAGVKPVGKRKGP
jgi:hypothetical protein